MSSANVALHLKARAASEPGAVGLVWREHGTWRSSTWSELYARATAIAHGLGALGLRAQDRVLVLAPPDRDWLCAVQGLWIAGAVPVLIDPGLDRGAFLAACARIRPRFLIGSARARLAKLRYRSSFTSIERVIGHGGGFPPARVSLGSLARSSERAEPADVNERDLAAILFTSGATGPPKGAATTHGNFAAQIEALRATFELKPGDVDLACFPLFALFNAAFGLKSVLPDMDFAQPAGVDPAKLVDALAEHRATQSFGSPAIWSRVADFCEARQLTLGRVQRVMIAGAPIAPRLVARLRQLLPDGEVHTPYGATECLPISNASGAELERLRTRVLGGEGAYLGRVVDGVELALVQITDDPIESWRDDLRVGVGEPGEICVKARQASREYAFEPELTALAKIRDPRGGFWHRLGDLARSDPDGGLWLLCRKSQRIETAKGLVFPVPIENVLDQHEYVLRSAVVGVGARGGERPIAIVECRPDRLPRDAKSRERLALDILRVGMWFPCCTVLEAVLFHPSLPVDPRHNAKIDRGALKRWAEGELA